MPKILTTQGAFVLMATRLSSVYGDKFYPPERIKSIWDEVKFLPEKTVDKIVNDMIADKQYPPMREAFRLAASGHKSFTPDPDIQELYRSGSCRWCSLTGMMIAKSTDTDLIFGKYAFICPFCKSAKLKLKSKNIPVWSKKYVGRYWPELSSGDPAQEEEVFSMPDEIQEEENQENEVIVEDKQKIDEIIKAVAKTIPVNNNEEQEEEIKQESFDL